jgi:hypothetical protein
MSSNLEQQIGGYFKIVNQLSYDHFTVHTDLVESMGIVMITIYLKDFTEDALLYYSQRGREKSKITQITNEMGDMFPYVFYLVLK